MSTAELHTVEIEPATPARASIIWMHGLGANAHDFEPIVPYLELPPELGLRFVFPDAPVRSVTINGGMNMQAWYDILSMDIARVEDEASVRDSERALHTVIRQERDRGIPPGRILLAGFSQGGAMALQTGLRYPETLGGLLALSCYIPLASRLEGERHPANQDTPIFMAHGLHDPVVPYELGLAGRDTLTDLGYTVEWHEYPMQHEVAMEEIRAIGAWLRKVV